ncbi:MAG: DUF2079 domain-containing protein [Actinobacteria bacterium]|nr:DUF2079 domain-containing protein [Actinomycetota bacterium]MCL5446279.1 DUF2079 domain-containing protein [Actinomycetota bacterium]
MASTILETETASPGDTRTGMMSARNVTVVGMVLLGVQLAILIAWSFTLYGRFSLTQDFASYQQGWSLIAHGVLDPYNSVQHFSYWQNDAQFIMWPLAVLYLLWPHAITMLLLQDVATVLSGAVVLVWLLEAIDSRIEQGSITASYRLLALLGLLLVTCNPWLYLADSFDYHLEAVSTLLALLAARALWKDSRYVFVWMALAILSSGLGATYIVAIGIVALIQRKKYTGLALVCIATAWLVWMSAIGGTQGAALGGYAYLVSGSSRHLQNVHILQVLIGLVLHPNRALSMLWSHRVDLLANIGPTGYVGIAGPWALVGLLVLLESGLQSYSTFVVPGFQNPAVYIFTALGTILIVLRMAHSRWAGIRRCVLPVSLLLLANSIGWAATWLPTAPRSFLQVSPSAAQVLNRARSQIPGNAEVISSLGVIGRFSERRWIYSMLYNGGTFPVKTAPAYFVIAASQGIELQSTANARATIGYLADGLHAQLMLHGSGIWVFRWQPPKGTSKVSFPANTPAVPAWTLPGGSGTPVLAGPSSTWRVQLDHRAGYLVNHACWRETPGRYVAVVTAKSTMPLTITVRDVTRNVMLARHTFMPHRQATLLELPFHLSELQSKALRKGQYSGPWPFHIDPLPPVAGDRLEITATGNGVGNATAYFVGLY